MCYTYILSYITKGQRGMSRLLEKASEEAKSGNKDIMNRVSVPAWVLVKKQKPIWLEQFISKENTVKTETIYESYEWQRVK